MKIEQKSDEWSEEDEKILKAIHNSVDVEYLSKNGLDYIVMVDWLKSLRPQNRCTYNPYKAVVESIAAMVEKYAPFDSNLQDFYDNVKVKCKDAKEYDSLYLQNTWKPSDKQMETLWTAAESYIESNNENVRKLYGEVLESLYNDLKKLREE